MRAFAEGKVIEYKSKHDRDAEWSETKEPGWNWSYWDYRVNPRPKMRPYTFEELQAEMLKGNVLKGY